MFWSLCQFIVIWAIALGYEEPTHHERSMWKRRLPTYFIAAKNKSGGEVKEEEEGQGEDQVSEERVGLSS